MSENCQIIMSSDNLVMTRDDINKPAQLQRLVRKLILMALSLLHTYICYTLLLPFHKAGTCLDAQQSMAKQPISGCVSNHSRTCGKSVSEKSE